MKSPEVVARVRRVLAAKTRLVGVDEMAVDQDLFAAGLDSLGAVNLIIGIEEEFDVVIPDDMLSRERTGSMARIAELVDTLLSASSGRTP
ncbi:phosphopantetheine-binding protein [Micromonospora sp. NPDC002296]|uniref:phosphopantetheine-binding protein n=1 Tax=Micromonospora sp. NPDC002296 TaxID=3154271 RepID=UPI003328022A